MKKTVSIILIIGICFSLFSITAFAQEPERRFLFEYEDVSFNYYKDKQGTYIIEDETKVYIAIPVLIEEVTDEMLLRELRNEFSNSIMQSGTKSLILFSQTVNLKPLAQTGVLNVTDDYLYLKCTNLNPSNAKRGFSYWIYYSQDGSTWTSAFFVNESLALYTRHRMADLGKSPYIKINIFSYYGTVDSCLFSVKEGGILG